jgi:hypothetical protein
VRNLASTVPLTCWREPSNLIRVADARDIGKSSAMNKHTLTITLDAEITDEDALVESVASATPEGSLSPQDIREDDRASATLVAGISKALKNLSVPGVEIGDPKVVARDE